MSANPVKGESSFVVDGATYTLRFTFDALVQIEQHFGKRIIQVFQGLMETGDGPPLADLRFIMWQALRTHHKELTLEETGEVILSAMRERTLVAVLEQAVLAAFPPPPETPVDPLNPPTGTGMH